MTRAEQYPPYTPNEHMFILTEVVSILLLATTKKTLCGVSFFVVRAYAYARTGKDKNTNNKKITENYRF